MKAANAMTAAAKGVNRATLVVKEAAGAEDLSQDVKKSCNINNQDNLEVLVLRGFLLI